MTDSVPDPGADPALDDAPDHIAAARETRARRQLLDTGAGDLPAAPWLHPGQPPSAATLIQFGLWRSRATGRHEENLQAALALLPAARAEVDQLEAAVLFTARAQGLSWAQISRAMGLGSAQAAQQRFDRLSSRVERGRA